SGWLMASDAAGPTVVAEVVASVANVAALILEVALGPILAFALLLAPVLIVEECSVARALREWWRFVPGRRSLIFLYETLVVALAAVTSLPLLFPVFVAAMRYAGQPEPLATVTRSTLYLLGGLALTPFIAFLAVANVFIYLNLRYQHTKQK